MSDLRIKPATTRRELRQVEELAWAILPDFYGATIEMAHIEYFIETLQSASALEKCIQDGHEYYLLNLGDTSVGYLGLETYADTLMLSKLYLLSEARGNQIGKEAIDFTHRKAKEKGFSSIELFVNEHNPRAMAFYERHGFVQRELVTHTFETGYSVNDWLYSKNV